MTIGALFVAACDGSGDGGNGGAGGGGFKIAVPTTSNVFVDRLTGPECLPRPLAVVDSGQTFCFIVETYDSLPCDCGVPGRVPLDALVLGAVREKLFAGNPCLASSDRSACPDTCACGINQEMGAASVACKADPLAASNDPAVPVGFCYIDDPASPLLAACDPMQKRMIGFVSPRATPTPTPGASLFLGCEN